MTGTLLAASTRIRGVANELAAKLATGDRPATALLESYLSAQRETPVTLRLHVTGPDPHPGVRQLTDEEKSRLGAPGLAQCYHRTGVLLYDLAEIAAVTTLVWLPARLRVEACLDLASGVPAWKALPGMQRTDLPALALTERERELDPADGLCAGLPIAVTSSAVLIVDGWRVAIATERITRAFTELLAGEGHANLQSLAGVDRPLHATRYAWNPARRSSAALRPADQRTSAPSRRQRTTGPRRAGAPRDAVRGRRLAPGDGEGAVAGPEGAAGGSTRVVDRRGDVGGELSRGPGRIREA